MIPDPPNSAKEVIKGRTLQIFEILNGGAPAIVILRTHLVPSLIHRLNWNPAFSALDTPPLGYLIATHFVRQHDSKSYLTLGVPLRLFSSFC